MFKVILNKFGEFPIFHNLVSRKGLVIDQKAPIFGARGQVLSVPHQLSVHGYSAIVRYTTDFQQQSILKTTVCVGRTKMDTSLGLGAAVQYIQRCPNSRHW